MPHIGKNPFIGFEKGEGERYGTPIYLTKEELKQLYQAEFSDTPSLEVQRDIFVFQCNVGCRVGDMMRLTKRDVINGAIEYIPNKTIKESAKTVVVPLNSMARAIVEKYKDLPGDSLLSFVASQNYNYAIKDALKKAGITRLVTTLNQLTRKDGYVNICEMKYGRKEFVIDKKYKGEIDKKIDAFQTETKTTQTVLMTMVTTYGVKNNTYSDVVQKQIVLNDLFNDL